MSSQYVSKMKSTVASFPYAEPLTVTICVCVVLLSGWVGYKLMKTPGAIVFLVLSTCISLWQSGNSYILERLFRKISALT
jgi:hypothetical protein